jgi:hypothetical protein
MIREFSIMDLIVGIPIPNNLACIVYLDASRLNHLVHQKSLSHPCWRSFFTLHFQGIAKVAKWDRECAQVCEPRELLRHFYNLD